MYFSQFSVFIILLCRNMLYVLQYNNVTSFVKSVLLVLSFMNFIFFFISLKNIYIAECRASCRHIVIINQTLPIQKNPNNSKNIDFYLDRSRGIPIIYKQSLSELVKVYVAKKC